MSAAMKITYSEKDKVLVSDTRGVFSGTVRGLACVDIIDMFIIELDEPLPGYPFSSTVAFYSNMSKIDE